MVLTSDIETTSAFGFWNCFLCIFFVNIKVSLDKRKQVWYCKQTKIRFDVFKIMRKKVINIYSQNVL